MPSQAPFWVVVLLLLRTCMVIKLLEARTYGEEANC